MNEPRWFDISLLKRDGWLSPDTYTKFFAEPPEEPAIYLLVVWPRSLFPEVKLLVAYVGQSRNLAKRFRAHPVVRELYESDFAVQRWFKSTATEHLRGTERRLIEQFDPPYNIIGRRRGLVLHG